MRKSSIKKAGTNDPLSLRRTNTYTRRIIFLQIIQVFADTLSSFSWAMLISMMHITREHLIFGNGQRQLRLQPDKTREQRPEISMASVRALTEAIMLQAIEDLWDPISRKESIDFFRGEGFTRCADMAGMGSHERSELMRMIEKALP